jgi:aminoglycoside phosphotransferase family enzyme/predicted kinase
MDAQALHKALLLPSAYPEKSGAIGFRETHVSRLYFTDRHVYKIKKPVDFGFLNFTTLDRRRFYCQEEVRLNRRFCPDTYLGVVEIRSAGDRVAVNGPGDIVDYAVRMKRLPEERMLDYLVRKVDDSLPGEMNRLARRIAGLHGKSEICRKNGGVFNREVVQANWRENFAQIAPFIGKTLSARAVDLCSDYVIRFLSGKNDLLLRREREGFVREGHGDLHSEHICLTDPICIYDCIEFNRRFRVGDVSADLAFLLMDLDYRGRRDLARILLAEYADVSGENREMEILLPFYKIYRAWVRGKVESFLSAETDVEKTTRQQASARAQGYFNLALGYLCRSPLLISTCGLMGVGKSAVAVELAAKLGAVLLRSDELRRELTGREITEKREDPFNQGSYSPEISRRTYDLLLERAAAPLASGKTVIADASFARQEDRDRFRRMAGKAGVPFLILFMECSRQKALARLDRRQALGTDPSEGRRGLYSRQAATFHPLPETGEVIRVDTGGPIDYTVHFILCELIDRTGMYP